ncbi:hypothetical protein F3J16_36555 [Burkholderia sp. Ap-962]|uniref:hypothetical protein n=1 Tax=Burkholderia sp. Ap-962 TaxID=2608333 RepID=UPI00141DBED0|nr:hypothetical protein [Burkholderia sp. Ap-962]NIF75623.1 hypothetical protein [Burkholderia sp. Ap-962]
MHRLPNSMHADSGAAARPYLNPRDGSPPLALPDAGVLVSVRGTTYLVELPAREHGEPSLWRRLAGWRETGPR